MKLFDIVKEEDFGVNIRLRIFIFSKFSILTFFFNTTEFPDLIPYFEFSIGGWNLFQLVLWIYSLNFQLIILSKNWK